MYSANSSFLGFIVSRVTAINVLDDVGGPCGFVNFLENINGEDPIERYELKEWSKFLGGTGRWVKPENLL